MKEKIDFIVLGTQKAGTTSLYHYLSQHPDIRMSHTKELHYFDKENYAPDEGTYHENFPTLSTDFKYGEITPSYLFVSTVAKRIKRYHPDIKLICILRNPIERAYSNYQMALSENREKRSFLRCMISDFLRSLINRNKDNLSITYYRRGLYSKQLKRYYGTFDYSQIKVFFYENYKSQQEHCLNTIFEFIDVDPHKFVYTPSTVFATRYTRPINKLEKILCEIIYYREVKRLEKIVDRDLSRWLSLK